jgi:hypothetical protein
MLVFNKYFYKHKKSKLYFGDRVSLFKTTCFMGTRWEYIDTTPCGRVPVELTSGPCIYILHVLLPLSSLAGTVRTRNSSSPSSHYHSTTSGRWIDGATHMRVQCTTPNPICMHGDTQSMAGQLARPLVRNLLGTIGHHD